MIKNNQKLLNIIHVLIDAIVVACTYMLAWYVKFVVFPPEQAVGTLSMDQYFLALLLIVPGYVLTYQLCGLYTPKRGSQSRFELFMLFKANGAGLITMMVVLFAMKMVHFSREMLAIFFVLNIFAGYATRLFIRQVLNFFRKKGYNQHHILLVGYSRAAEGYMDRLISNPQWGYQFFGILDDKLPVGTEYKGVHIIGTIEELPEILAEHALDEIGITLSLLDYDKLGDIVNICEKTGVHTRFVPDYSGIIPSMPFTEDVLGLPVINIRYVPLANMGNIIIKRIMDIVGSIVAIIISSPVMLFAAIAIRLDGPGPIIFKQERVGYHNTIFTMYKFRTMKVQNDSVEKHGWTTPNDPRVTRVGRFMRSTSIDELPQLFNILKGEMSLVGPRPERPQFVEKFKEEIPRYMIKHQVRPGLTGWAQVNGYRGDTSILKRVEYDIDYIENWSVFLDIKILFLTVFKGFINKNAY